MQTRHAWLPALCWLGVTMLTVAHADEPPEGDEAKKAAAVLASARDLTLTPQAVERPLMKYRLMPAEFQLRDGNAAPILLRLPWDQTPYFSKVVPTFDEYLEIALNDPKLLGAGNVFPESFYLRLRRAAYRRTADWEYPIGEAPFAYILLPDVQGSRSIIGRGLSVWIRFQIAHGELDKAREGILVGLANSRHYGRSPFVITQLVCCSIDSMMLYRLEELLAQPKCPNMYWALTALPRPLINLRPSIELEQRTLQMSVDGLDNLDKLKTEKQWDQCAQTLIRVLDGSSSFGANKRAAKDKGKPILGRPLKRARAELSGRMKGGAKRVAAMSDSEVGVRWFLHRHIELTQESAALMSLEPQAAIPLLDDLQNRLGVFSAESGHSSQLVLEKPLSVFLTIHKVQRRIDALRVVEAIRNYAATHESQLPKSLNQISDTPIPNDPLTGKPFHYEVVDGTARLTAAGFQVGKKKIGAIRYHIKLRK